MQPHLKCTFKEENISLVIKSNSTTKGRVLILTGLKKGTRSSDRMGEGTLSGTSKDTHKAVKT